MSESGGSPRFPAPGAVAAGLGVAGAAALAAVRFLTIVPVRAPATSRAFGAAAFPAVGLLIGLGAVIVDVLLALAPFELRNVGVAAFLIIVTGGLHQDGLADTLDALGGRTREERLRIMTDGSVGAFAVLGLMIFFATRLSALSLLGEGMRVRALLVAPALGRLALVACAWRARAARPDGLGATFVATLEDRDAAVAAGTALGISVLIAGGSGALAFGATLAVAMALRSLAERRFGGVTGDVLGAGGEIVETVMLAFLASRSAP